MTGPEAVIGALLEAVGHEEVISEATFLALSDGHAALAALVAERDALQKDLGILRADRVLLVAERDAQHERYEFWKDVARRAETLREQAVAERDSHLKLIAGLLDAVIWMSGSDDFAPDAEGHDHWVELRDGVVAAALAVSTP